MRKKTKTRGVVEFIEGLHKYIVTHPQFRKNTKGKSETAIQTELRPLILNFLEKDFDAKGYADAVAKANKAFYWEGQEGKFGRERAATFASRNYPDFIIEEPYLLAIEYKQSQSGSLVKQAIGQAIMHTMSGDFDFVYVLFHDQNKDKKIEKSAQKECEHEIIEKIKKDFNVFLRFI
ncbi:MAG: hypothetical protein EP335_10820 [Alphaproteobacteria bacterium]|nr:MAG: hypothetical protein EP335_10820 [Alphaproteobacteria bacterium]